MWKKTKELVLFAWNCVIHPMRNASIVPSSAKAAEAMVAGIDFTKIRTVVELGPGTGVFTEELLKRCILGTKVVLVEIEEKYVALLQERFGDKVIVEHASVADLETLIGKHGGRVDLIVSGLPVLIPSVTETLLVSIKRHTERGTIYRFFSYVPPLVKRVYRGLPVQKIAFVLLNLPPLWVYELSVSEHT
ncbi:MAG: methyltransferase domain-containing protein [Candidatus Taylorbacteria bacterium]|nr:methyltransferase domain-containing protein [Candidatus Taylorbacteria bacterium]